MPPHGRVHALKADACLLPRMHKLPVPDINPNMADVRRVEPNSHHCRNRRVLQLVPRPARTLSLSPLMEARRVMGAALKGTLNTVAKDAKVQVDINVIQQELNID